MRNKLKTLALVCVLVLVITAGVLAGNKLIGVTEYTLSFDSLPAAFDGFRIVQVSDLHNDTFGADQSMLLEHIEALKPDIIAVTGDMIDRRHTDVSAAMMFVRGAAEIAPVYFVTGNHEQWCDAYDDLKTQMLACGVHILDDDVQVLRKNGEELTLLGLAYPAKSLQEDREDRGLAKMINTLDILTEKTSGFCVLLAHRPELFGIYAEEEYGIELVLSGHAHGGQVRLPGIGAVFAPSQGFFPKYDMGVYTDDNTLLVVSRGLGNSSIPVRLLNPPELMCVTLRCSPAQS